MQMKGLILLASPRRQGNTEILLEQVIRGMTASGCACELIRLAELHIHPCLNCGGCEKTGQCVIKDDMTALYAKIEHAERLVLGSPIYFYSLTAQAKIFIDRAQAMWSRKYNLGQTINAAVSNRKGFLVSVAATTGPKVFAGAILTTRYAMDAMNFSYSGELLVRGADEKGAVLQMPAELSRAQHFGARICAG